MHSIHNVVLREHGNGFTDHSFTANGLPIAFAQWCGLRDRMFGLARDSDFMVGMPSSAPNDTRDIRMDVTETATAIEIDAEMPGVAREDMEIYLHDNVLTLKGEKKTEKSEKKTECHCAERFHGCISRDIGMPDNVVADQIRADYKNGVLHVTVPKNQRAADAIRQIPITAS